MKKLVINISDSTYEKFRFEALHEKKSIQQVIENRIFLKPFHEEVEREFDKWFDKELIKMMGE